MNDPLPGSAVAVTAGRHKGKTGTVVGRAVVMTGCYIVRLDDAPDGMRLIYLYPSEFTTTPYLKCSKCGGLGEPAPLPHPAGIVCGVCM